MRDRGFRLHQDKRAKAKARAIVKDRLAWNPNAEIKDEDVGKVASVHGADCSCSGCGNPRRHFGETTIQEKRSQLDLEDPID